MSGFDVAFVLFFMALFIFWLTIPSKPPSPMERADREANLFRDRMRQRVAKEAADAAKKKAA